MNHRIREEIILHCKTRKPKPTAMDIRRKYGIKLVLAEKLLVDVERITIKMEYGNRCFQDGWNDNSKNVFQRKK